MDPQPKQMRDRLVDLTRTAEHQRLDLELLRIIQLTQTELELRFSALELAMAEEIFKLTTIFRSRQIEISMN